MSRRVVLVTGAPCSGKTSYVTDHAQPGDLVLDQDQLGQHRMQRRLAHVAAMTDGTAWVIRCCPDPTERQALAARIAATDTIHLDVDTDTLLTRARARPNAQRHVAAVRHWLAVEAGTTPAHRGHDPTPRTRTRW